MEGRAPSPFPFSKPVGSWQGYGDEFCANMAAEFALAVIQETLGRLDSCQDGDHDRRAFGSGFEEKKTKSTKRSLFSVMVLVNI